MLRRALCDHPCGALKALHCGMEFNVLFGDFDMPQPINKIVPNPETYITSNALDDKPEMALLVCHIFATWATIEQQLNFLFYLVLGTDAGPAIAIYAQLRTQGLQSVALEASAKAALSIEDFEIFKAAVSAANKVQTPRNHLAHWTWGLCRELPDVLVLFDPQMLRDRDFTVQHSLHTSELDDIDLAEHTKKYFFNDSASLAYSKADLERSLRDLVEAKNILMNLRYFLRPRVLELIGRYVPEMAVPVEEIRPVVLKKLNDQRLFREALAQIRASRKSTSQSPDGSNPRAPVE